MTIIRRAALIAIVCAIAAEAAGQERAPRLARVRSANAAIAAAMSLGAERSPAFRTLTDTLDASDGLVYIEEGRCGQGVRACLVLSVTIAGPYRLLRIVVDSRHASACRLAATIGHELQHAVEALSNPAVRSSADIYFLFFSEGRTSRGRFETPSAVRAGLVVEREACA